MAVRKARHDQARRRRGVGARRLGSWAIVVASAALVGVLGTFGAGCIQERLVGTAQGCPDCGNDNPIPVSPACGNGRLEPLEQCEGANLGGASCTSLGYLGGILRCGPSCRFITAGCTQAVCGDGRVEGDERCDDGNALGGDGCSASCQPEVCGNGVVDVGELCDDGNLVNDDGCPSDCRPTTRCGDGVVDPILGEQCDDGNGLSQDGCSSGCTEETLEWSEVMPAGGLSEWSRGNLVYDRARGLVVRLGGYAGVGVYELGEDGWTPRAPATPPPPRRWFGAAYDAGRGRTVVFGGIQEESHRDDTWEYDGAAWQERELALRPSARQGHAMAYDPERGRVVLFGGLGPDGLLGDTWLFDGASWWQAASGAGAAPTPRYAHAMAFDEGTGVMVLFGGRDGGGVRGDLWAFDGSQWLRMGGTTVSLARSGARMVWWPTRGALMLHGGADGEGNLYGDLWELQGAQWQWVPLANSPQPRAWPGLVADPLRRRLLVHGGVASPNLFQDTLQLRLGSDWPDERCENGLDDDADGFADCADPDCAGRPGPNGPCALTPAP